MVAPLIVKVVAFSLAKKVIVFLVAKVCFSSFMPLTSATRNFLSNPKVDL